MTPLLNAIFSTFLLLFMIAGIRIYLRTGLKGELIRATGIMLILIAILIDNTISAIIGFIIFNVGWIILVTFEHDMKKEMYRQSTLIERLTGNVPKMSSSPQIPRTYNKKVGIATGILCLFIAFIYYRKLASSDFVEIVFILILALGGIFFIGFSLLKKNGS
jgi:hypothetical protein